MSTGILHSTSGSVENGASWEVWFKKNGTGYDDDVLFAKESCYAMRLENNELYYAFHNGATWGWLPANFTITEGIKYHIISTYNVVSDDLKIYVNGAHIHTDNFTSLNYNDNPYKLNSRGSTENSIDDGGQKTFYQFRIYGRPLTGAEVKGLYRKGRNELGYGDIVTDGLVLHLDAGISDSYPGSGTTWYDLSGNGNNGTLVGFSSLTNGHMVTASDKYISLPWGSGINPATEEYTFIAILRAGTTSSSMWLDHGSNGTNQRFYASLHGIGTQSTGWSDSTPDNTTTYYFAHILCNGKGNISLYLNKTSLQKSNAVTSYTIPSNFELGGRWSGSSLSYDWLGAIDKFIIYNKVLSSKEIEHNYNILMDGYN